MDDVGSIVEPTSSLAWAAVISADFQRVISRFIQNISACLSCKAQRGLRTILIQKSKPKYAYLLSKIGVRFCVRYDWWRQLQPTSSVSPVCEMSSVKWRPLCLGLNVLKALISRLCALRVSCFYTKNMHISYAWQDFMYTENQGFSCSQRVTGGNGICHNNLPCHQWRHNITSPYFNEKPCQSFLFILSLIWICKCLYKRELCVDFKVVVTMAIIRTWGHSGLLKAWHPWANAIV